MTSIKYSQLFALMFLTVATACGEEPSLLVPGDNFSSADVSRSGWSPTSTDRADNPASGTSTGTSTARQTGGGEAWVELRWTGAGTNGVNLDLHVKEPNGNHIFYLNTEADTGSGKFDAHPECRSFDCDGSENSPSERISWDPAQMAPGTYEIWVENDGERAENFELEFHLPGSQEVESGNVGAGQSSSTFVADVSAEEEPGDCLGKLRARGVNFSRITIKQGQCEVKDAVMVSGPINGITYRVDWARSTTRFRTSCEVALALHDSAALMREHDINTVYHMGSYECRNKRGGRSLSQHGLGRAMDYAGFRTSGGTHYSVVRHWEHNTTSPRTQAGRVLRSISTGLLRYFDNVLDGDVRRHDDHFHAELSGR